MVIALATLFYNHSIGRLDNHLLKSLVVMKACLQLLDIERETNISFRMFCVLTSLAERVTMME